MTRAQYLMVLFVGVVAVTAYMKADAAGRKLGMPSLYRKPTLTA